MAYNGNDIIILKDGTAIAGSRTQGIKVGAETIEVSSATQGQWKNFIAGRKEWSVPVGYLVTAYSGIRDVLQVGNSFTLVIRDRGNTATLTGTAILETCEIEFDKGHLVKGSFKFKGTGALT